MRTVIFYGWGTWGIVALLAGCSSEGTAVPAPDAGATSCCDGATADGPGLDSGSGTGDGAVDGPATGSDAADASDSGHDATGGDGSAGDAGPTDAHADGADAGATLAALTVSTGTLVPAFDPNVTDYTVTSLNSLYPIEVTVAATSSALPMTVHGVPALGGVPVPFKLSPREDFTVTAGAKTYTVHYLPADLPAYTVTTAPGAGTEDVLLTANGTYLLIVDRSGAPLYYRTFAPAHVENFQQFALPGGEIMYTTQVGPFNPAGWSLGVDHIMDSQFRDVDDVQLLASGAHATLPAEGHDFLLLDTTHYVTMSYVQRTVDLSGLNPAWSKTAEVMNAVVQEVDEGSVLFEWDSANVPSLYVDSVNSNTFKSGVVSDYLHMNSMCIDPADGNFVFSFRHTSSIVKIDRNDAHIIWTLGGKEDDFGLAPDQVFSYQHYVKVQPDGSLWVFDNGNNLHQTRVISFVLDEVNKKVTSFTDVYDKPSSMPQTTFMGSYAHLDTSRYMFGWGGWMVPGSAPDVTEVSGGSQVWSLTFTGNGVFSYRALPIPAL